MFETVIVPPPRATSASPSPLVSAPAPGQLVGCAAGSSSLINVKPLIEVLSLLKITTAAAPAAIALRVFSANRSSPRLISAIFPATLAGISSGLPRPQLTYSAVTVPILAPVSALAPYNAELAETDARDPKPSGSGESTSM